MDVRGSLVCVGTGMLLGAHLGARARNHIEQADVVFVAVSDPLVELWVQQMHPDVRSLQPLYGQDRSRRDTYEAMMQAAKMYQNTKDVIILGEHRNGKKVQEPKPEKVATEKKKAAKR